MLRPGNYRLTMIDRGQETSFGNVEVLEVDGTLIKVNRGDGIEYINTASQAFISATSLNPPVDPLEVWNDL